MFYHGYCLNNRNIYKGFLLEYMADKLLAIFTEDLVPNTLYISIEFPSNFHSETILKMYFFIIFIIFCLKETN